MAHRTASLMLWLKSRMGLEFMHDFVIYLSEAPIIAGPSDFADGEGAEAQFLGIVRGEEDGKPITGIEYNAYRPMADNELAALCERAQHEHGAHRMEIRHRLGFVPAKEPSIIIRVWTKHSALSFDLCRWYLKEIKTSVPIWKKPVFSERCIDSAPSASTAIETAAHHP